MGLTLGSMHIVKKGICSRFPFSVSLKNRLFLTVTVTAHEFINTTGCVNQLRLTSVERVRSAGDFQLYQRISFAFELDSLLSIYCRTRQEHIRRLT